MPMVAKRNPFDGMWIVFKTNSDAKVLSFSGKTRQC